MKCVLIWTFLKAVLLFNSFLSYLTMVEQSKYYRGIEVNRMSFLGENKGKILSYADLSEKN